MEQLDFLSDQPKKIARPESVQKPIGREIEKTTEYADYIRSARWKGKRQAVFKLRGKRCEWCGAMPHSLEIHHKHYDTFKNEGFNDLEILCKACHEKADDEREEQQQDEFETRCEESRYSSARETYIEKKYGGYRAPFMEQEFDEWLEQKQEDQRNYGDYY